MLFRFVYSQETATFARAKITNHMKKSLLLLLCTAMLAACEKVDFSQYEDSDSNVVLQLSCYERVPFTSRAKKDVTELCSRINIAIFKGDTKVKTIAQKEGDNGFGTIAMTLAEGTYDLVVIAHNGEGTATISNVEKVTFANNHITDTFYYYGQLEVTSEKQQVSLTLTRPVAAFRLVLNDALPSEVKTLRFYYTGGSSTFSPKAGFGNVNSRQTENLAVSSGQKTFEVFTFPHSSDGLLKVTVSALDASDEAIAERVFENVPVTPDEVTRYTGNIFDDGVSEVGNFGMKLQAEAEWAAINDYEF